MLPLLQGLGEIMVGNLTPLFFFLRGRFPNSLLVEGSCYHTKAQPLVNSQTNEKKYPDELIVNSLFLKF